MGSRGADSELIVLISPDDHQKWEVGEENRRAAEWGSPLV